MNYFNRISIHYYHNATLEMSVSERAGIDIFMRKGKNDTGD